MPVLLVLTSCGSSDDPQEGESAKSATIADITITGDPGAKPEVAFKPPVSFADTESDIVDEGPDEGDKIQAESAVTIDYLGINASDGSEFGSTYGEGGQPATFTVSQVIAGFAQGLDGAHAGDRVLISVASKDGYDPSGNGGAIRKGDSIIFVVDVLKVENPAKPAQLSKSDIPKLAVGKDGNPTGFEKTPGVSDKVSELGVAVLKEGKGDPITSASSLTVNYLGQIYPAGKVFDESYSGGQPATFELSGVIPGWQQGLVGQQAGSRVVLVIPSELGYGKAGSGKDIPPDSNLIFVIDIVSAE